MALPAHKRNQLKHQGAITQHEHEDDAYAKRVIGVDQNGDIYESILDEEGIRRFPVDALIEVGEVDIDNPDNFEIINHTVLVADSEFAIALPAGTTQFIIKVRDNSAKLRLASNAGETSTAYRTIKRAFIYESPPVDFDDGRNIYLQSDKAGVVVEVEAYFIT